MEKPMSEHKTQPKVVGLIRLSTQEQAAEGRAGIDRQRHDIEVAARLHGLEVTRIVEVIESGTKVRGQRDFEQIFRELKSGTADGVACSGVDRLIRADVFSDYAIFDHFKVNRKRIFTPSGIIDPASQSGFMESTMRAMFAGVERQLIRERTQGAKEEKRKKGLHPGSAKLLPRGVAFDRKSGAWSYVEPHASRIRLAYTLLFENRSYYSIAARIGAGWTAAGIKKALSNPLWMGVRSYSPTGDRRVPLEVRVIAEADALVSRETWEAAQAVIAGRNKNWKMTKRPPRFLLAGLLRCSCGKLHYVRAKWHKGPAGQKEYYYCGSVREGPRCGARSYSRESVEATVERIVTEKLLDPKLLLRMVEMSQPKAPEKVDGAKMERELAKLEAKRKRTVDLAVEGLIGTGELKLRLAKLDEEVRSLRVLAPAPAPEVDARELVKLLAGAFMDFRALPFADKRTILQRVFREFVIENGGISSTTLSGAFLGGLATSTKAYPHTGFGTGSSARRRNPLTPSSSGDYPERSSRSVTEACDAGPCTCSR
jgi:DNA invertase Pin-like site-specific DNA recombinase